MTTGQPSQKIQVSQGVTTEPKLLCSVKEEPVSACCLHLAVHMCCVKYLAGNKP